MEYFILVLGVVIIILLIITILKLSNMIYEIKKNDLEVKHYKERYKRLKKRHDEILNQKVEFKEDNEKRTKFIKLLIDNGVKLDKSFEEIQGEVNMYVNKRDVIKIINNFYKIDPLLITLLELNIEQL